MFKLIILTPRCQLLSQYTYKPIQINWNLGENGQIQQMTLEMHYCILPIFGKKSIEV